MTGSKVEAPKMSKTEWELSKLQIQVIKDQMADDELLKPFVLQAMRLTDDGSGGLRQMTEDEYKGTLTGVELQSYNNLQLQLERQEKALKGELPLSEGLIQQKETEFKNFKEAQARSGNIITGDAPESAAATSTSGIQALKTFNQKWGLVEDAERRGELTSGQQLINQTVGLTSDIQQKDWAELTAFPQRNASVISGASSAMQPFQYYSGMQYNANMQNAANKAGLLSDLGGLAGTLGYAAIMSSDPKVKKNISRKTTKDEDRALKEIKNTKSYSFHYKGEPSTNPKRVGLMATEAPASIATPDRKGIYRDKQVGLLTMAVKALAKKIDKEVA